MRPAANVGVPRGPAPARSSWNRFLSLCAHCSAPLAASYETTASTSPRCSCVTRCPSTTIIPDQPGPIGFRQSCFGGCSTQSDAIVTFGSTPSRFGPRNSGQSPGCTDQGLLVGFTFSVPARPAKNICSLVGVQRQLNSACCDA